MIRFRKKPTIKTRRKAMFRVTVNYKYHQRGGNSCASTTISINTDEISEAALKRKIEQMRPGHVVDDILDIR